MYHKRHKYDLIVIFSVFVMAISLFLAISEIKNIPVPCDLTGGCDTVLNSRYSHIFRIPVAYLGVGFSVLIIILALLANHYIFVRRLLTWCLGFGALGALSFILIQFFALKSICQYCLTVDILIILMFLWDLNIEHIKVDL